MTKIITSLLIAGLVLVPSLSFAATTAYSPAYIASLEQLLNLLEQELNTLLASQNTAASSLGTASVGTQSVGSVAAPLNAQFLSSSMTSTNGILSMNLSFSVTAGNTAIDIPEDSTGIQYQTTNLGGAGTSFSLSCGSSTTYAGTSYCEVPPNSTSDFKLAATVPASAIVPGTTPQLTVSQIKYYTGMNTSQQSSTYYQPKGLLTTNTYISYLK